MLKISFDEQDNIRSSMKNTSKGLDGHILCTIAPKENQNSEHVSDKKAEQVL
uniref:Uncharacterized protein n=1 Tax=Arundo donax TaxID=35708 RepID=A0A0A9A874_ARUDO